VSQTVVGRLCQKKEDVSFVMKPTKTYLLLIALFLTECSQAGLSPTSLPSTPSTISTSTQVSVPENTSQLIEVVMEKLNSGQELSEIVDDLIKKQISLKSYSIDFNGDGKDELFLAGTMLVGDWLRNVFWVASSSDNGYLVMYTFHPDMFLYEGDIYDLGDLNGDRLPDLLVASYEYGNGCGEYMFIFGWRSTEYTNYSAHTDFCIETIKVGDKNELVVTGSEGGWLGAGPARKMEQHFVQNTTEYVLSYSKKLTSNYRIHILSDAQEAYDAGNDTLAIQLWERAAHDPTLIDYPSMRIEDDRPEIYQPAFSLYRLYAYYIAIDNETQAQQYLLELHNLVDNDTSPGSEFLRLAVEAKKLLDTSKDPEVVCAGIYDYLNSTNENMAFLLDHWYWGDLNDSVDFCPLVWKR
jgi:hypothetical protein